MKIYRLVETATQITANTIVLAEGSSYVPPPGYELVFSHDDDPIPPTWSGLEFKRRFTPLERLAIFSAAATNPLIGDYLQLVNAAQRISPDDEDVLVGLQYLEGIGLIAAGRAAEILETP